MNKNKQTHIIIDNAMVGQRLDKAVCSLFQEYSRVEIQKAIKNGYILDNEIQRNVTPAYKIQSPITLVLTLPSHETLPLSGENIDFSIIYEDDDILVVDKPANLTVHPGAGIKSGTLVHALIGKIGIENLASDAGEDRPGILHRLDKDTSGLLLIAKTNTAYQTLKHDLAMRDIHRVYQAVIWGTPTPREGTIDAMIGRNPQNRLKMVIVEEGGRSAVTHYKVVEPLGLHFSLIECELETGRTHQIRLHMEHIGNPVVGDPLYKLKEHSRLKRLPLETADFIRKYPRQALHAKRLEFTHPQTGEYLVFESPMPTEIKTLIEYIRKA